MCHHFSHAHAGTVDRSNRVKKTFRCANAHTPRLRDIPTVGVRRGLNESNLHAFFSQRPWRGLDSSSSYAETGGDNRSLSLSTHCLSLSFKKQSIHVTGWRFATWGTTVLDEYASSRAEEPRGHSVPLPRACRRTPLLAARRKKSIRVPYSQTVSRGIPELSMGLA
jgi:hypothetical protein